MFDSLERAGVMIDRDDATKAIHRMGMFTARGGRTQLWFISAEDALPNLDLAYVRAWLVKLPVGDRHLAILDDLERRFRT